MCVAVRNTAAEPPGPPRPSDELGAWPWASAPAGGALSSASGALGGPVVSVHSPGCGTPRVPEAEAVGQALRVCL